MRSVVGTTLLRTSWQRGQLKKRNAVKITINKAVEEK